MHSPASEVVRFVPYIYMKSRKAQREIKIRLSAGLHSDDVAHLLSRINEGLEETPNQALQALRRQNLLDLADDWQYMTGEEVDRFLARDQALENGVDEPPADEIPTDVTADHEVESIEAN